MWGWVDRREKEGSDKTGQGWPRSQASATVVRWQQEGTISSLVHGRVGSWRALPWTKLPREPYAVGASVCASTTCVHVRG